MIDVNTLLPPYPKTIYRFRPYSQLSLKELLYGEVFFSSRDELNDPYDVKNLSIFQADVDVYKRILEVVIARDIGVLGRWKKFINLNAIAKFLAKQELFYNEVNNLLQSKEFENVVFESFSAEITESLLLALTFIKQIRTYINWHVHRHCYVVAFSKKCNNPVVWSHYASSHKGYSLVFNVNEKFRGWRSNPGINKLSELALEEVHYKKQNVSINGFYSFPGIIWGKKVEKNEIENYWELRKKGYLTKFESWKYEEEVRLILDDSLPDKVDIEGASKIPVVDRLFYYDMQQFTGLIYGSKMIQKERDEIFWMVQRYRSNYVLKDDCRPIFIFYDSQESNLEYEMKIVPLFGLDSDNRRFEMTDYDEKLTMYQRLKQHYEYVRRPHTA